MPLGLAGVHAIGHDAAPQEHRAAWRERIDELASRYRDGAWYAACNSEKGAGGSLDATKTMAARGNDGSWRVSGEKILASGGMHADFFFSTAKVTQDDLPGAGVVEFFFLPVRGAGVEVLEDWDGFGMRSTESQTVRYSDARADATMGFPNFIATVRPLQYWFCLFAAIPLGCAAAMLRALATPAPQSPALRLRFADAQMRIESLRAYLAETASMWRPCGDDALVARVLRTKTYVTQESTKLCAELFALSGGRHYRRTGAVARLLCDSFAGTALRPPLPLALDTLVDQFAAREE
jgi:alkylation response protein AidB-like acyl-CoA dehydrogenase